MLIVYSLSNAPLSRASSISQQGNTDEGPMCGDFEGVFEEKMSQAGPSMSNSRKTVIFIDHDSSLSRGKSMPDPRKSRTYHEDHAQNNQYSQSSSPTDKSSSVVFSEQFNDVYSEDSYDPSNISEVSQDDLSSYATVGDLRSTMTLEGKYRQTEAFREFQAYLDMSNDPALDEDPPR